MKGENIAIRLRQLAASAIKLCRGIRSDPDGKHIATQLSRAATGAGANYEEARGAESMADFIHKLGVANKEMRETLYWLTLLREAEIVVDPALEPLIREADELVAILTTSINTAKRRELEDRAG